MFFFIRWIRIVKFREGEISVLFFRLLVFCFASFREEFSFGGVWEGF